MNYQKELDSILENLDSNNKTLLLHSCCAPCSSYVLEYLSSYFKITVLYYNPNISPVEEYNKRKEEQIRLINELNKDIKIMDVNYENELFEKIAHGLENEKEGGARCKKCYYLRLEKTALTAKENNFDYFATTLTVSPYKNSTAINEIGKFLEEKYQVKYLCSDFKKKEGYKRSIELSKIYGLYRQDYCGCIYSKRED